jgi:ATP-dependent Lon protease
MPIDNQTTLRRSVRIKQKDGTFIRRNIRKKQKPVFDEKKFSDIIKKGLKEYVDYTTIINAPCSDEMKFLAIGKLNEITAQSDPSAMILPDIINGHKIINQMINAPHNPDAISLYTSQEQINNAAISVQERANAMFYLVQRNKFLIGSDDYESFDRKIKTILRGSLEINNYKTIIAENKKGISEHNKKIISTWIKIEESSDDTNDKHKIMDKIKYSLALPHNSVIAEVPSMAEFFETIAKEIYGLHSIKVQLMQANSSRANVIGLAGPPGIGKTQICKSYAKAAKRPIAFINIGTIKDATTFTGTYTSWLGAEPGAIVKALCNMSVANGIIVFDEIDKLDMSKNYSIYSTLLAILDPSQNKKFEDEFLAGIHIDLSRITFICTMNNIENIDHILLDRIKIIPCAGYSFSEKTELTMNYFIKRFSEEAHLDPPAQITQEDAEYLVASAKKINGADEPGVRQLIKIIKSAIEWIVFVNNANKNSYDMAKITQFSHKMYPISIELNKITKKLIDAVIDSMIAKKVANSHLEHLYL